ncbi:MAG: NADPH:quinone reductase [Alphaproteobacteria bacterium]|nr:NADPH:quinone reductase [Alphaproteobacteria bacterium]
MADVTIAARDGGSFSAYVAKPASGSGPGILVIQEIFGVNKVMREICDGLAAQGYIAVCPDLFWRQEPGIQITDKTEAEWQKAFSLYKGFDEAKGVEDLIATLETVRKMPGCNGRVGTVGFCLGGKLAYLMATRSSADCNVSYYGVGIEGALNEASAITKPYLCHIAAKDKFVPAEAQAKVKEALAKVPVAAVQVYEACDHAFARIGGERYDAAAAKLANGRTAAFFTKNLGGAKRPAKTGATMTTHAIRIHATGGPEAMKWEEVPLGTPGAGELLIRNTAVGLNYIDTYHRSGLYPLQLPSVIGMEGAGVVEKVGPRVKEFKVGDRVAYAQPMGSYAERRIVPAERMVKIPSGIDEKTAAAMMLKGMTAEYLIRRTYKVQKGDTILVHAAAGGVGLILCQWGRALGAKIIGTVSSEDKAALAKKHGCHHPIVLKPGDDLAKTVKEITKGKGLPVVYDGVGKDTFMASLDCLRPRGMMISFGSASGPVAPFSPAILGAKGSLFLTRPSLMAYVAARDELVASAKALFAVVKSGKVKIRINQTYPLSEAAQAHRDLEARKTTGSTVLLP